MLSEEHIKEQLRSTWAGCRIIYHDVTGSTNNDARDLAKEGAPHGTLVVADRQDSGRGTRGRKWETPSGTNIAMSLIVRPTIPTQALSMMTLVMGLSVAEGIDLAANETKGADKRTNGSDSSLDGPGKRANGPGTSAGTKEAEIPICHIKWPNDIVINSRKICGILTELHMNDDNTVSDVVIGVGINVNMEEFPDEIKGMAGSLLTETGLKIDRSLVVARCMERFEANYESYVKTCDLSRLKEQYEMRLLNKDERVRILDPKGEYEGVSLGITDKGALLVKTDTDVREINAGEVSVRGLYGYV